MLYKNTVLNAAIDTALNLPRQALWTATAVTVVFSLEAGITIIGDTIDLKTVGGTPTAQAAVGDLQNRNVVGNIIAGNVAGIAVSAWVTAAEATAVVPGAIPFAGATVIGTASGVTDGRVIYASEIFRGTVPTMLPTATDTGDAAGSNAWQVACHTISGNIKGSFLVNFQLTGASFSTVTDTTGSQPASPWAFTIDGFGSASANCPVNSNITFKGSLSGASTLQLGVPAGGASCTINDGGQICLVYKLAGTSALKTPGTTVTLTTQITQGGGQVGAGGPIVVAESKQGANFTLEPELGGEVYITAASGNKEFISSGSSSPTAFMSSTEVKIGYINYSSGSVVSRNGSTAFSLGADTADAATLVIENGQFSASPGGSSAGRVYLQGTDAIGTIETSGESRKATFNLDSAKLKQLTTVSAGQTLKTPIVIKVDGQNEIKDTEGGDDPLGNLTVTMGASKTSISDTAIASALRRIPYDGKVCKVFNIPSPVGAADALSLRITNDSDQTGVVLGTLYDEAGEVQGEALDLLKGHIDYTKNPPVERASLGDDGSANKLELLGARETVILNSKNIATAFGKDSWEKQRWVLEIRSSIPRIEVFNLLRNVENITLQPLSNVSSGATGVECSPIP